MLQQSVKQMEAVLEGRLSHDDATDAVRSMIRLPIHQYAMQAIKECENPRDIPKYCLTNWPHVGNLIIDRARELWRQGER